MESRRTIRAKVFHRVAMIDDAFQLTSSAARAAVRRRRSSDSDRLGLQ